LVILRTILAQLKFLPEFRRLFELRECRQPNLDKRLSETRAADRTGQVDVDSQELRSLGLKSAFERIDGGEQTGNVLLERFVDLSDIVPSAAPDDQGRSR
jgi:hypothetical protein